MRNTMLCVFATFSILTLHFAQAQDGGENNHQEQTEQAAPDFQTPGTTNDRKERFSSSQISEVGAAVDIEGPAQPSLAEFDVRRVTELRTTIETLAEETRSYEAVLKYNPKADNIGNIARKLQTARRKLAIHRDELAAQIQLLELELEDAQSAANAAAKASESDKQSTQSQRDRVQTLLELYRKMDSLGNEIPQPPIVKGITNSETLDRTDIGGLTYSFREPLPKSDDVRLLREWYKVNERQAAELAQHWKKERNEPKSQNQRTAALREQRLQKLESQIRAAVSEAFEYRQRLQRAEVNRIRDRLDQVETRIKQRDRYRDEIVDGRVADLLSDGPSRPSTSDSDTTPPAAVND